MPKINHRENVGKTIREIFEVLDYKRENNKSYYFINCLLCGNKKWMRCDTAYDENVVSCGCYNKMNNLLKSVDITNMRSGMLVAKRDLGVLNDKDHVWECQCDCGKLHNVAASLIINQRVNSCGCKQDIARALNAEKAFEACKYFIKDGTNYISINKTEPMKTNISSSQRCISYDKNRKKWIVQMTYKGKHYHFGRYDKLDDAIKERDIALEARKNDDMKEIQK